MTDKKIEENDNKSALSKDDEKETKSFLDIFNYNKEKCCLLKIGNIGYCNGLILRNNMEIDDKSFLGKDEFVAISCKHFIPDKYSNVEVLVRTTASIESNPKNIVYVSISGGTAYKAPELSHDISLIVGKISLLPTSPTLNLLKQDNNLRLLQKVLIITNTGLGPIYDSQLPVPSEVMCLEVDGIHAVINLIQLKAGFSGSPVYDIDGQIVGMIVGKNDNGYTRIMRLDACALKQRHHPLPFLLKTLKEKK